MGSFFVFSASEGKPGLARLLSPASWAAFFILSLARLCWHPPNTTPLFALLVLAVPLIGRIPSLINLTLSLLVTDVALAWMHGMSWVPLWSLGALFCVWLAAWVMARFLAWGPTACMLVGSSTFWVMSNLQAWWCLPYAKSVLGLAHCFFLALPFLATQCLGDVLWYGLLRAVGAYVQKPFRLAWRSLRWV
jgi:hypothetical protein